MYEGEKIICIKNIKFLRLLILTCSPDAPQSQIWHGFSIAKKIRKVHTPLSISTPRTISDFSRTIMSPQFTTRASQTYFIAPMEQTENPVYSHQARPVYRNAISFIGDISRDEVARKRREKTFFNFLIRQ